MSEHASLGAGWGYGTGARGLIVWVVQEVSSMKHHGVKIGKPRVFASKKLARDYILKRDGEIRLSVSDENIYRCTVR